MFIEVFVFDDTIGKHMMFINHTPTLDIQVGNQFLFVVVVCWNEWKGLESVILIFISAAR